MSRLFGGLAAALLCAVTASAADHIDSPAAVAEPMADLTDVYAWMSSDASKVNLTANVAPFAGIGTTPSTAVVYALHINSSATFGGAQTETLVLCKFYAADGLECWAGDEYVEGDASDPAGMTSPSGKLRVFAGLRDDPFYFELDGFNATVAAVVAAAPSLTADAEGCPGLDSATSTALVTQLQRGKAPSPGAALPAASNTFAGARVMALVVQLDKSVLTDGGPILGVWASTHRAQ